MNKDPSQLIIVSVFFFTKLCVSILILLLYYFNIIAFCHPKLQKSFEFIYQKQLTIPEKHLGRFPYMLLLFSLIFTTYNVIINLNTINFDKKVSFSEPYNLKNAYFVYFESPENWIYWIFSIWYDMIRYWKKHIISNFVICIR